MRPPTSSAALCDRSSVLSLSCFLFVLLLSVSFAPSSTLAADGPPFSPCQVTSIRLSTLDGSQTQDVWSDGQYKSLVPFKLSSTSSSGDKTQLRAQVIFVIASEASWRSVVTAQVNNDGFVQYFRAPGGDRADPPTFEQELQGFHVGGDGKPNHLVINADCESMFETDVSIVVGDGQAGGGGGGEGAGGGSVGNAGGGGAGSSDGGNSGSPTTPPPDQGASDAGSSTSTAPELIDADGNGVPDNPYADNDSDGNGVPDNPAAAGPDSTSSGGVSGGDVSVGNNGASGGSAGAGAGADVGASSNSSSGSSEVGGQDGSVNQLGDGNSAASTTTTASLTPTALLIVAAAAAAL